MKKGKFVVIYGMNNLGKTTLAEKIVEHLLLKKKIQTVYLKYPIYELKPTGPRINTYLRKGNPEGLEPGNVQEIYAQNRRDFEPVLLKKYLEPGVWVVAEDYVGTGIAWGMIGDAGLDWLEEINAGLYPPDLAFLVDGKRFGSGIEKNHTHESRSDLWQEGRRIHLHLGKRYGWNIIKANQTREQVLADALKIINARFL